MLLKAFSWGSTFSRFERIHVCSSLGSIIYAATHANGAGSGVRGAPHLGQGALHQELAPCSLICTQHFELQIQESLFQKHISALWQDLPLVAHKIRKRTTWSKRAERPELLTTVGQR